MASLIHHTWIRNFTLSSPFEPFTTRALSSPFAKTSKPQTNSRRTLCFSCKSSRFRWSTVSFCLKNQIFEEFSDTILPERSDDEESEELGLSLKKPYPKQRENGSTVQIEEDDMSDGEESEELGLSLKKPYPKQLENGNTVHIEEDKMKKPEEDEILEPFFKFFRPFEDEMNQNRVSVAEETEKVNVEYYEPKAGDFVVGVVVSGNENKLDVNVGADLLGTMLTKEVLPLSDKEMNYLLCDLETKELLVPGKVGIVKNDEALSEEPKQGRPVVEVGTILFAEVLGRTLGGRPLLSTRRLFRRMAWHRVRQMKQLNEPIEVVITEWNTGGLLTRIEGLRAFLPKAELMNRVNNYTDLKENVGRRIHVLLTRINEETNDLILSEKEAWEMMNLQPGTLLEGTVKNVFSYGAQIRIGETNRSGLLHISKITQGKITSVSDLLKVDEKVKAVVVKSMFSDQISLSIAELESAPGLFLSNREKVFSEAKEMAKKYRQKVSVISAKRKVETLPANGLPFGEDDERLYANWRWFEYDRDQ